MKEIICNLPDISFCIKTEEKNYNALINKVNESIITYNKNANKIINIEYIVDREYFDKLKKEIKNKNGKIYDSFKNQKHKEVIINNEYYYLVDCEEYICNKKKNDYYKIIVKENNETSANWVVRILRELYLREKEDNGFIYLHGTGVEIDNNGLLLLGTSGSGKTTLAVKFLETKNKKAFISNDRVLVNEKLYMDYFPHAITYAMGTVKNNKRLDEYFRKTNIFEKNRKKEYENAEISEDCNTPLTDVAKVFDNTVMKARVNLKMIIYPRFIKEMQNVEILDMTLEEKNNLLKQTNFTPFDTEALRKPWIKQHIYSDDELVKYSDKLVNKIIDNIEIKKVNYGVQTEGQEILNELLGGKK